MIKEMIKLYLDTCSIQRPLDTMDQTRIRLEAEAIMGILSQVTLGKIKLISSTVLEMEIIRNPLANRRVFGEEVLAQATTIVIVDDTIEKQARLFERLGIKAMDALHLAAAEASLVDYFCTCDDQLLRKASKIPHLPMSVISPLQLIEVLEL